MNRVGIIGYGNRMKRVVSMLLGTEQVKIVAVADIDVESAKRAAQENGVTDCRFYSDAEEMLEKEALDGVCIGTRCSTHARYACMVADKRIPMLLEKPVGTTYEDLTSLKDILYWSDKTVVSFPLRHAAPVTYVKEMIDSGRIGEVAHVQAYNNAPYGRLYYQTWYRDEGETGGLFLQKATHDLDYIQYILGDVKPVAVCAMRSKQVFKGSKPAGLRCKDCDERESCLDSPENVKKHFPNDTPGEYCCYAADTGNEDSGSVLVRYDNGMHVAYSQNFVVRADAGRRGARFVGYLGTLELDFVSGTVTLYHHMEKKTEVRAFDVGGSSHFGGNDVLVRNFVEVMQGKGTSKSTLKDGILSAELCLAATLSSKTDRFIPVCPSES